MKVHKIIDVLRGKAADYRLAVPNLEGTDRPRFIEWMDAAANSIERAQHFVFENVPIEADTEDGSFDLPGVTEEERDMFSMGLLPLPFESCWFEAPSSGHGEILCYFLQEIEEGFRATPFRVIEGGMKALQFSGEFWDIIRGVPGESPPTINPYDPFGGAKLMNMAYTEATGGSLDHHTLVRGEVGFLTYLLLMLSSKTTEVRETEAPAKLNKRRKAKGQTPIPAHRVVSIIPRGAVKEYRAQEGGAGGTRSSPRIHWRRSHLRQLPSGKMVAVARTLVGYKADPDRDVVSHSYRVKL